MKTLLAVISMVFGATYANATSMVPNVTMAELDLQLGGKSYVAKFSNYGDVVVKDTEAKKIVGKSHLMPETLSILTGLSAPLGTAEIAETHNDIVCYLFMMPMGPSSSVKVSNYDNQSGVFNGQVRTVLTEEGCYIADHTFPKEEYQLQNARSLRSLLEVLTIEIGHLSTRGFPAN